MLPSRWVRTPLQWLVCPVSGACTRQFHSSSNKLGPSKASSTLRKEREVRSRQPSPLLAEVKGQILHQNLRAPYSLLAAARVDGLLQCDHSTAVKIFNNCLKVAYTTESLVSPDTVKQIYEGGVAGQLSILFCTVSFHLEQRP